MVIDVLDKRQGISCAHYKSMYVVVEYIHQISTDSAYIQLLFFFYFFYFEKKEGIFCWLISPHFIKTLHLSIKVAKFRCVFLSFMILLPFFNCFHCLSWR